MTKRHNTNGSRLEVGEAIRSAREGLGITIRELGRRSEVSPAQISRIEAGAVKQPSIDTLISIARALYRNPKPLFIVSGHIKGEEARDIMRETFRPDSELVEEWSYGWESEIEAARTLLAAEEIDEDELRKLAVKVFVTADTEETLFWDSWLGPLVEKAGGPELRELVHSWQLLTPDRQKKVLDYLSDQTALSVQEQMRGLEPDNGA